MNRIPYTTLVVALASLLAACSSTPVAPPAQPMPAKVAAAPATPAPIGPPAATARAMAPASTVTTVALPAYLDPANRLATERSVYFDFDDVTIKPDDVALVERHGKFLAANPAVHIRVEGNTDERGGTEYNLALGQKRAEAVVRALRIYGAKDAQLEATSWGKAKPKATGHDEAAWAQNRRDDLQYPAQ